MPDSNKTPTEYWEMNLPPFDLGNQKAAFHFDFEPEFLFVCSQAFKNSIKNFCKDPALEKMVNFEKANIGEKQGVTWCCWRNKLDC